MATKKKKSRKNPAKKRQRAPKQAPKKKLRKKKSARKVAGKKPASKKAIAKNKTAPAPKGARRKSGTPAKSTLKEGSSATSQPFLRRGPRSRSGEGAGDLQGLSRRESADSESVNELLEEGNSFEAGVVQGVEEAGNAAESEVRTREVLEDDVPEEYLDEE